MKKLFYLPLMLGAMAVAFTSCNDTEENGPTSQTIIISHSAVPAGAENVRNIAAVAWNDDPHVVVYSTLTANGFTLLLDATPHASTLHDIAGARIADEVTIEGFSTNDGTFQDEHFMGEFWNERTVTTDAMISMTTEFYWYADRDLTIRQDVEETTFDLNLRQGWNRVFVTADVTIAPFDLSITITTTPVTGLAWVFDPADNGSVPTAAAPTSVTAEDILRNTVRELRSRGVSVLEVIR